MARVVARVDDGLVREIDLLVERGVVSSRSEAVRLGLEALTRRHRQASIGQRIVDGYRERPQTEAELGWTDAATRAMIAAEPWGDRPALADC